jgi:hypothetical protein
MDADTSRREHESHVVSSKVAPAAPDGLQLRDEHGAHMQNEAESADA